MFAGSLDDVLRDALVKNKVKFVELVLQQGVVMKEYLTVERLEKLYLEVNTRIRSNRTTRLHSSVGNVSDYRCASDCKSAESAERRRMTIEIISRSLVVRFKRKYVHTCDTSRIMGEAPEFEPYLPRSCAGNAISRFLNFAIMIFRKRPFLRQSART